jgi:hypothetical protein
VIQLTDAIMTAVKRGVESVADGANRLDGEKDGVKYKVYTVGEVVRIDLQEKR